MRKIILLFSVIISFAFSAVAENQTEVLTETHLTSDEDSNTNINRSIVQFPILNVVYDSDTKNIKITSSESVEAIVYIYDHNGNIVSYSNTLNTIEYTEGLQRKIKSKIRESYLPEMPDFSYMQCLHTA